MENKGIHIIADIHDIKDKYIYDNIFLKKLIIRLLNKYNFTIIQKSEWKYQPQGYSLTIHLSESHVNIHTYPEHNSMFFDIFTCGDNDPEDYFLEFCKNLEKFNIPYDKKFRN